MHCGILRSEWITVDKLAGYSHVWRRCSLRPGGIRLRPDLDSIDYFLSGELIEGVNDAESHYCPND